MTGHQNQTIWNKVAILLVWWPKFRRTIIRLHVCATEGTWMVPAIVRYRSCYTNAVCELTVNMGWFFHSISASYFVRTAFFGCMLPRACVRVRVRSRALDCAQSGSGTCKAACFWWDPRTTDTQRAFFKNLELLGLGSYFGAFGVFSPGQSASILVLWVPCLLFLQKTKSLYPTPKYLFGTGIWI